MEKYDYRNAITEDVKDWIMVDSDIPKEEISNTDEDIYNWIYDEIFDNSYITGNGTYFYDTEEKCSEYLSGNFDLLYEAEREFGLDDEVTEIIKQFEDKCLARYFDCTIRCYLLMECIYRAVEELIDEGLLKHLTNE